MAKFCGVIGYTTLVQTSPGVWQESITEVNHRGDVLEDNGRFSPATDSTNDNLSLSNKFSIVVSPYAKLHYHSMRYIEFMGTKWKITSVNYKYPRLIISVGGVYNDGEQA